MPLATLRPALRFAISDRRSLAPAGTPEAALLEAVVEQARGLARAGVDFFLIREKDLPAGVLVRLCRAVVQGVAQVSGHGMRVLVSSRADVALAGEAGGVHLSAGPGELRPSQVRAVFRAAGAPEPYVSIACHTPHEVPAARDEGASAILFAPVFGKVAAGVEVVPAAGLQALAEACALAAPVPVFALGGVTEADTGRCLRAGAAGVAGIRLFRRH